MLIYSSEEAHGIIRDFLEKGKREKEMLAGLIQQEVQKVLGEIGIATKKDISALEAKIAVLEKIQDGRVGE